MSQGMLRDFNYELKTHLFFGPSQGGSLFHPDSLSWNESRVILLHHYEAGHQIKAYCEMVESLLAAMAIKARVLTIDRSGALNVIINDQLLEHLEQSDKFVLICIGDNDLMQAGRELHFRLHTGSPALKGHLIVIPTDLSLPVFLNNNIVLFDAPDKSARFVQSSSVVADFAWFNPTFTLGVHNLSSSIDFNSQTFYELIALAGEVISPFTIVNPHSISEKISYQQTFNSIYWNFIPNILICIEELEKNPEDYELRALFIWNNIIASLPIIYPQANFYSGDQNQSIKEGKLNVSWGIIKEASYICKTLCPELSMTEIQAELTLALFHILSDNNLDDNLVQLKTKLEVLLGGIWSNPVSVWRDRFSRIIKTPQLSKAISTRHKTSATNLFNLLGTVRIVCSESGHPVFRDGAVNVTYNLISALE
jgi:hypothetical protein